MLKPDDVPEERATPKEILQYIMPMIKGKAFCDLGCGEGSFLKEATKYCNGIGVELYDQDYAVAVRRGLTVVKGDIRKITLPMADVYYNYSYYHDIEEVIENVKSGILIVGGTPENFKTYPDLVRKTGITIDIPEHNWRLWLIEK